MVRQFTARKFEENIATNPKKQNTPVTACPRTPMISLTPNAASPSSTMAAPMASRQVTGVGATSGAAGELGSDCMARTVVIRSARVERRETMLIAIGAGTAESCVSSQPRIAFGASCSSIRRMNLKFFWRSAGALLALNLLRATAADSIPVTIRVDATKSVGGLKPIWRFFGADEPNYAYMTNGRKLIAELGELAPKQVFFRAHNLLTSGDGTPALKWGSTGAYREDASGQPIYDWTIVDRIFDTYLARGVRPYAQIGFMPKAMSIKPEPYQHQWTPRARYDEIYPGG